jgi:hypothetical protein
MSARGDETTTSSQRRPARRTKGRSLAFFFVHRCSSNGRSAEVEFEFAFDSHAARDRTRHAGAMMMMRTPTPTPTPTPTTRRATMRRSITTRGFTSETAARRCGRPLVARVRASAGASDPEVRRVDARRWKP